MGGYTGIDRDRERGKKEFYRVRKKGEREGDMR